MGDRLRDNLGREWEEWCFQCQERMGDGESQAISWMHDITNGAGSEPKDVIKSSNAPRRKFENEFLDSRAL